MLEQLRNFKTRKAIAKAFTKQCDMGEYNVVAGDVHAISSEPTMEGFDIVFTINGEDGEQFKTSIKNDGPFSETYVGKIELVTPTYTHEVYYLRKNASGFYVTRRETGGTTQTRDEWLDMLHKSGELDNKLVNFGMIGMCFTYTNLGHPIFDTYDAAKKYAEDLHIRNTVDSMLDKLDIVLSKPKPVLIEVWGIKPLSKEPVMLSAVDAASFYQACFILMEESKIGITMERDSRTRVYFFYNGRPVFTSKEAAQKCIDTEYGRIKPKRLFQIWGFDEKFTICKIGCERAETFKEALRVFWHRRVMDDGTGRPKNPFNNGEWTYNGYPVFETEEAAREYGRNHLVDYSCAGTKQFVKFLTADQVTIKVNDKPLPSVGGTKHNPLGEPLGTCSNFSSSDDGFSFDITPTEEIAKIIDRLLNTKQITKVSDIKCFNQLASVIGKGQAQVELFKVMHNESCWVDIDVDDFALALDWALTPQGYDYWESLYVHIRKAKESNHNGCKSQ